jgi:spermidine/putrescine transport system substrate-binding protein
MTAPGPGPDLLRGLTQSRVSRRRALQVGGLSTLGFALTACGIKGTKSSAGNGTLQDAFAGIDKFWSTHHKTGTLDFENWPLYIDVGKKDSDHPSLDLFTKQTGIKVKYTEGIQQVDSYFGKIQPVLASGQGIGKDIIVITNGLYLDKLIESDFLIPLDQTRMTNFYKYASDLAKNPSYDRGNNYTMPWQSGITGIGYDPKKVGKKITSWQDLQDPALKGKIGMFGDTEDMPGCALLAVGAAPETSTEADWHKAGAWLTKQRPLVRKYYEQDYIAPLKSGDIWATMAWSGDIFQAKIDKPNLEFVVPDEGAMIWSDNMCIPKYAAHPVDAMIYMDWVYQPAVAAMIADYVNYITPVTDAKLVFEKDAKDATSADDKTYYEGLATSPLIFPTPSDYAKLHRYRVLTKAEQTTWNSIFQPVYQS